MSVCVCGWQMQTDHVEVLMIVSVIAGVPECCATVFVWSEPSTGLKNCTTTWPNKGGSGLPW